GRNRWPNCSSYCPNTAFTMWNVTGRLPTWARTAISASARLSKTLVATRTTRPTSDGRYELSGSSERDVAIEPEPEHEASLKLAEAPSRSFPPGPEPSHGAYKRGRAP